MRHSYYEINGIVGQFLNYRFIGSAHILLKFSTRNYEHAVDEMPMVLLSWHPVNEGGKVSYDHIEAARIAQSQLEVIEPDVIDQDKATDVISIMNTPHNEIIDPNQDSLEDTMESQYKSTMDAMVKGALFANEELRKTILRLKGDKGKEFVGQAKQIVNAINAARNIRDSVNDYFKTGISLMKVQNTKPKNGKTDNDNKED
jgi:hypothetical protein